MNHAAVVRAGIEAGFAVPLEQAHRLATGRDFRGARKPNNPRADDDDIDL